LKGNTYKAQSTRVIIMTKRTVTARHRTKNIEMQATLDDEENTLIDSNGNELDPMWWEYSEPSPGFLLLSLGFIGTVALMAALAIFGGES
jgi:hypothetical protein